MVPAAEDLSQAIGTIEERIEALSESAERSRKLMRLANGAAVAGGLWIIAMLAGIVAFGPVGLVFATTLVLGGIVLAGSSQSSLSEAIDQLRKAEALRGDMIDRVAPQPVRPAAERPAPEEPRPSARHLTLVVDNDRRDQR